MHLRGRMAFMVWWAMGHPVVSLVEQTPEEVLDHYNELEEVSWLIHGVVRQLSM